MAIVVGAIVENDLNHRCIKRQVMPKASKLAVALISVVITPSTIRMRSVSGNRLFSPSSRSLMARG
jgi:hypothetical protein